jgi:DNA-binding MarR family transcriptional regulator
LNQDEARLLYFRMFNEIGIINQLSSNRLERVLPDGMSVAQFSVLNHFVRLGGQWAPSRLARAFQVTKGAMTNTLQRLEAQGLVKIVADPADARAKLVEITAVGRKMRETCVRATGPMMGDVSASLQLDEVGAALPILEKLRKALDATR